MDNPELQPSHPSDCRHHYCPKSPWILKLALMALEFTVPCRYLQIDGWTPRAQESYSASPGQSAPCSPLSGALEGPRTFQKDVYPLQVKKRFRAAFGKTYTACHWGDPGLLTLHPGFWSSASTLETCSLCLNTGCTAKQLAGDLGASYLAFLSLGFPHCKKGW